MKIKQAVHNGNVEELNIYNTTIITRHLSRRNWPERNNYDDTNNYIESLQCLNRKNIRDYNNKTEVFVDNKGNKNGETESTFTNVKPELVCNIQYKLDTGFNENLDTFSNKTEAVNLEGSTQSYLTSCETFVGAFTLTYLTISQKVF